MYFMTILLIIKRFDFGGAENHVCDLGNSLVQKGHKVIIVGGSGRQLARLHPDIKNIKVKFRDILIPLHILKISFIIKKYDVDIIHAHQRLAILIGSIAGFISGRKVVATIHGRAKYDLKHFLSRRILSKIIFVSQFVFKATPLRYNIHKKSVFIPNGVIAVEDNYCPKPCRIGYISKLNKTHSIFLELFINNVLPIIIQQYNDVKLYIIGEGRSFNEIKELVKIFNQRNNRNYCHIVGYEQCVHNHFRYLSLVMGVGRVAMEAASFGVPVLLANNKRIGGLLTIEKYHEVKDTNFVDVKAPKPDTEKIVNEIISFFENDKKYKEEAKNMSVMIKEEFSLDIITDKIISLYEKAKK